MKDFVYMSESFNEKQGLLKALKAALHDDGFIASIFDMLLGEREAAQDVEYQLKNAAVQETLNEMVAVRRLYKGRVMEEGILLGKPDKNIIKQLKTIRRGSRKFMRKVLIRTLKEKGMVSSLLYIIKAFATPGYPLDDLLAVPQVARFVSALLRNAAELGAKEMGLQPAINEEVIANKLRRAYKHGSCNKGPLDEEIEDKYGGRMPVNVYMGRFQPFHLGHLSNLEEAAKRGLRTVICPVMKGKTAKAGEHPFEAVEGEMFRRIKAAYGDLVVDVIPVKNAFVEFWINPLREAGYEPITWTTGMDRKPSYDAMIEKYKDKYGLVNDFEVIGLDKDVDAEGGSADDTSGISGTGIRKCLVSGDEEGFRRQMPKCLWDMYPEMREIMMQYAQPAITESRAYMDFKKCLHEGLDNLLENK
jgi:hypothetical protein